MNPMSNAHLPDGFYQNHIRKEFGAYYQGYESHAGYQMPAGLFHSRLSNINIPGQSYTQHPLSVPKAKYFDGFTSKEGYQVPAGVFHRASVISVPGQTNFNFGRPSLNVPLKPLGHLDNVKLGAPFGLSANLAPKLNFNFTMNAPRLSMTLKAPRLSLPFVEQAVEEEHAAEEQMVRLD
eukprot:GEMP01075609.1.p1 GENE.GEMP01075609.1~~GEMP01075609.1.p1  ORF type:complete len:179 (+),score=28.13 GEMP01075609.1:256-792(+)